jgi:hypothetical protein
MTSRAFGSGWQALQKNEHHHRAVRAGITQCARLIGRPAMDGSKPAGRSVLGSALSDAAQRMRDRSFGASRFAALLLTRR